MVNAGIGLILQGFDTRCVCSLHCNVGSGADGIFPRFVPTEPERLSTEHTDEMENALWTKAPGTNELISVPTSFSRRERFIPVFSSAYPCVPWAKCFDPRYSVYNSRSRA